MRSRKFSAKDPDAPPAPSAGDRCVDPAAAPEASPPTPSADDSCGGLAQNAESPSLPRTQAVDESGVARTGERNDRGEHIAGRYTLDELIGKGANGAVWTAFDTIAGTVVAVKLLRHDIGAQAARLQLEVTALRLLRLLNLPGVVRLLDEGVDGGRAFIVMELVQGAPFFPSTVGPHRWADIAFATVGLLETLARVHATGIVHRDLKPANVLVDAAGRPTILDFGLSHLSSPVSEGLTREGDVVGTPAYLAPEQINGEPITPRTDLYAVGALLYGALSGRLPHEAKDLQGVLRAKLTRAPLSLRDVAPDVPAAVASVIDQLLSLEPEQRPKSALEVLGLLQGHPVPVTTATLRRIGPAEPLAWLVEAATHGRSMDVIGPSGSGRTRCLAEVAAIASAGGRKVHWALPGRRAFTSLEQALGGLGDFAARNLAETAAEVEHRLRAALGGGDVLLCDDAERLDRASAGILERCRDAGAILRAFETTAAARDRARPDVVELAPLDAAALRSLFAGPDRILHLREDAARALWARTEGVLSRVEREVTNWVRARLARWDGDLLVIDGDGLDRLEAGLRVTAAVHGADTPGRRPAPLPPHLDETLAWLGLAWPHADAAMLGAVMAQPVWRVEADLDELIGLDAVREWPDGRLEPRAASSLEESWPRERRQAAHRAIAAVLTPGTPGRLTHVAAAGGDELDAAHAESLAKEASAYAERLAREGRLGQATATLEEGLRATYRTGHEELSMHLLSQWVEIALADGTPRALDRILYEICRATPRMPLVEHLEGLVRAALAVSQWTERALSMVGAVQPFASLRLERCRQGVRVAAARRCPLDSEEESVLQDITKWVDEWPDPESRARLDGWLGRLRYRQNRFDEAAELHRRAAAAEPWTTFRLSAQLNAASSLMEAYRHEEAAELAHAALALAASCRHPLYEMRAEWILRSVLYRTGQAELPDLELAEAVGHVGVRQMQGAVLLNEAAVAFRAGQMAVARDLARDAHRTLAEVGEALGALLAGGLKLCCGEPAEDVEVARLVGQARKCPVQGVRLQTLALVATAGRLTRSPADASDLAAVVASSAKQGRACRMEVLSLDEVCDALASSPSTER